jgi:hypothetical protein
MRNVRWPLIAFLIATVVVFFPRPAHAYLDPSTLSQVTQALYLVFYSAIAGIAVFFKRIKLMFAVLRQKLTKK